MGLDSGPDSDLGGFGETLVLRPKLGKPFGTNPWRVSNGSTKSGLDGRQETRKSAN